VASDIETYLKELQAALTGADPALVQDALFDAEEHLQAELAAGRGFAEVVEDYGTPEEVAAAYRRIEAGTPTPSGVAPGAGVNLAATAGAVSSVDQPPAGPPPIAPPPIGPAPGWSPAGTGPVPPAPMPVTPPTYPSVWQQIFGVFYDPWVWKSLLYMLLSLATGIFYFTVVVTMISTSFGMIILIVGVPLLLLTLGFVRGMALFEGRLVELLLGTRMPRRPRAEFPGSFFQRLWFWLKDGRTWASMAYLVLMLPIGIVYFTLTVTFLAVGLGLIALPFVQLIAGHTWIDYGIAGLHEWLLPAWSMPFFVIAGFVVLLGWLHATRWIGRGHAAYAKAMLVRLAK
jgi:Putative sensor/HAAS